MNASEINKNDIDIIEKYLDGELKPEEKKSFEERMQTDQDFKNLIEARNEIRGVWLKVKIKEAVKEEVKSIYKEGSNQEKNFLRILPVLVLHYRYYAIAASLLILIGILFSFLFINKGSKDVTVAVTDQNKTYQVQKPEDQIYKGGKNIYKGHESIILLIKPDSGAILKADKDILFHWKYNADSLTHLTITDENKKLTIFSKKVSLSENRYILPARTLRPGIYSWYVGDVKVKWVFVIQ